jgi:hypothetical protein
MDNRATHPLKAWRETQQVRDPRTAKLRPMGIADAARAIGVPYQTWMNWEKYPDEEGARIPTKENMDKLLELTNLQVRPDHFYDLPTLRARRTAMAQDGADAEEAA